MNIERYHSNQRMSQIVACGPTVYLAGQVAQDPSQDIEGQTRQVLAQIETLLTQAGSHRSQLLTVTIWLADIQDFQHMNKIWDAWVDTANPPARACVQSPLARSELKVEMQVTALRHIPGQTSSHMATAGA
ncbi:RidA family protein [Alcaligenes sp. SDU_A2]|uniref:RidA family protein n=1 Tax=Alcaligenes sp. SDU_A2 TaxID=3136634 RepID=UPI00311F8641